MPPEGENSYGRPYGDPYQDAYGDAYGERDEDDPYGPRASRGEWAYGQGGDFQRAVDALDDPLSDPLPGQRPRQERPARQEQGYGQQQGRQSQQGYAGQGHQGRPSSQGYPSQGYEAGAYEGHGRQAPQTPQAYQGQGAQGEQEGVSPWFRPHREPDAAQQSRQGGGAAQAPSAPSAPRQGRGEGRQVPYGGAQSGTSQHWQGPGGPVSPGSAAGPPVRGRQRPVQGWNGAAAAPAPSPHAPHAPGEARPERGRGGGQGPGHGTGAPGQGPAPAPQRRHPARLSETAAMPVVEEPGDERAASSSATAAPPGTGSRTGRDARTGRTARDASSVTPADRPGRAHDDDDGMTNTRTVGLIRPDAEALSGRAARRRASQRRARPGTEPLPVPGTRLEARRAARARREGPAIIASRFLGEVFISAGVVMLLFVAYQLWWTNVLAGQEAGGAAQSLQDQWGEGGKGKAGLDPERRADDFAPGEGFAILYLPKLDVRVPIAQGVSKPKVLDKGLVGHYDSQPFKTAMPWDEKGNFALAGHRNTHGEPFRYVNRLVAGDEIVVETATKFYTYKMANRLPTTSPANTSVIRPVPQGSGFERAGRYITLTTCTPEFTSKFRLIVWGKMVEERPRSKGKPDALVG